MTQDTDWQTLVFPCNRSGCEDDATRVTLETLSTPYCDAHFPFGGWKRKFASLEEWFTNKCPFGEHPSHVGCWDYIISGERKKFL